MPEARKRTVHFFEPVRVAPDGTEVTLDNGFWPKYRDRVAALAPDDQFVTIREVQYRGAARHCATNSSDYLYLGKTREPIDHPENAVGDDDEQPLILEDGGRLVEPFYVYAAQEPSNIVATLRSSAGPSTSAVEEWLTRTIKNTLGNDVIRLRPVVRYDQMERLNSAQSIARFSVKLEKDQHLGPSGEGVIDDAVRSAYDSLGDGATMTFEWSYGVSTPPQNVAGRLIQQAKDILSWGAARSAEATVIREDEDGDIVRDQIDFIKDKVVFKVPVGDSPNIVQSAAVVVSALREASVKYRELGIS